MTITMPIPIPIIHLFRIIDANAGSFAKKESTMPKIPEKKMKRTPHPRAALAAPKGAFFIILSSALFLSN